MSVIDDDVLLKMAEAEILGEAKRAAARHSIAGVSGWKPCSKPNKTFLTNTLLQTLASNRILARKKENKSSSAKKKERKLLNKSRTDKTTNFIFQKPGKTKEKSKLNASSSKSIRRQSTIDCKKSETTTKTNVKKVKLKKG